MRSRSATEVPPNFITIVATCYPLTGQFALPDAAAYVDGDRFPLNPRNRHGKIPHRCPAEVAKFSALAAQWWDPKGKFAPLHKFNPVRLGFIRDQALQRISAATARARPFEGLRLLDIGCGGGAVRAHEPSGLCRRRRRCVGAEHRHRPRPRRRVGPRDRLSRATTAEALLAQGRALRRGPEHGSGRARGRLPGYLAACARW